MEKTAELSQLVKKAQHDPDAFAQLYAQTVSFSYAVARRYLSNEQDIEDVLQTSYLQVARSLSALRDPDNFIGWLRTIVVHECQKCLRTNKKLVDLLARSREAAADVDEQGGWTDLLEQHERYEAVQSIMDGLPDDQRMCAVLFYYEGMSLAEIAEQLGVPQGTVKSRLYHARKKLEKELKKLSKHDRAFVGVPPIVVLRSFFRQGETKAASLALRKSVWSSLASQSAASAGAGTALSAGLGGAAAASGAAASTVVKAAVITLTAVTAVGGGLTARQAVVHRRAQPSEEAAPTAAFAEREPESITQLETESGQSDATTTLNQALTALTSANARQTTASAPSASTGAAATTARPPSSTVKSTTERASTQTAAPTTAPATTVPTTRPTTSPLTTRAPVTQPKTQATTAAPASYQITGGVVRSYSGSESSVTIPSSVDGQTVTAIGSGAFSDNQTVRSVQLPNTVKQIGQQAFSDCTALQTVSLPSSLVSIGIGAFDGCTSLTGVTVPSGTQTIGDDAFSSCRSLRQVTIPSSVSSIGDGAFDGCDNVTIRCAEGSAAHTYAVSNGISYQLAEGL